MSHLNEDTTHKTIPKEIPALNGIRALAVLVVVTSHAGFGHIIPGGFGVTVFFLLSGYLITTLLLAEFGTKGQIDIRKFYIRRFLRLTPPLLVTVALTSFAAVSGLSDGGVSLVGLMSQLLYFANYYAIFFSQPDSIPAGTGVLWSLAVEEHFYLIYPVLLSVLLAFKKGFSITIWLSIICLLVLLWRFQIVLDPDFYEERIYYATDTRIDSILFGCLLAVGFNPVAYCGHNNRLGPKSWLVIGVAIAVLIFTFTCRDIIFRQTLRYTIQGLALMPLFYFSISRYKHWLFSFLNSHLMQKIGVYSYSIYLIHLFCIKTLLLHSSFEIAPIYLLTLTLILSVLYSVLIHRFIERYFYEFRKKYR